MKDGPRKHSTNFEIDRVDTNEEDKRGQHSPLGDGPEGGELMQVTPGSASC